MKEQENERIGIRSTHKIRWLNLPGYKGETWNPIIGCSKVSDGCKNCYAEKQAFRMAHMGHEGYKAVTQFPEKEWNGESYAVEDSFEKPLRWKKPRVIFVCSMGDLFFNWHSREELDRIFEVIGKCQQHIFIILTKRPDRMKSYIEYRKENNLWYGHSWVWMGVTAENQKTANERIPELLKIHAAVRFVSVEPMLGQVELQHFLFHNKINTIFSSIASPVTKPIQLDWVICGGESGHHARPMHPDWARSLRDQCHNAGVPFFFKQWGEWMPNDQYAVKWAKIKKMTYFLDTTVLKVGRKAAGNLLDGERWEQYPALPPDPLRGKPPHELRIQNESIKIK